jgi:hypothetical protein
LVEEVDGAEAELLAVVAWRGEAPNGGERRRPALGFRVRRAQKERGESAGGGERMRMRGERARGFSRASPGQGGGKQEVAQVSALALPGTCLSMRKKTRGDFAHNPLSSVVFF